MATRPTRTIGLTTLVLLFAAATLTLAIMLPSQRECSDNMLDWDDACWSEWHVGPSTTPAGFPR